MAKVKEKPTYRIPFDADGDMMNYVSPSESPEWKDIYEFDAQLTVVMLRRGRSSVTVEMVDSKRRVLWISIAEFMRLVKSYTLTQGRLPKLWWTFKKQGHAYFVYEVQLNPKVKKTIDDMSQLEMARLHRFAPAGEPMFIGAVGTYFGQVFYEKGGFTPAISKELGWDKE